MKTATPRDRQYATITTLSLIVLLGIVFTVVLHRETKGNNVEPYHSEGEIDDDTTIMFGDDMSENTLVDEREAGLNEAKSVAAIIEVFAVLPFSLIQR